MRTTLLILCLSAHVTVVEAGEFRNLGFDEACTNNVSWCFNVYDPSRPYAIGSVEDLLPGWELYGPVWGGGYGPSRIGPIDSVSLNDPADGWPLVSLYDETTPAWWKPNDGQYLLSLWPDFTWSEPPTFLPYTLSQTATIPSDAVRVVFWTDRPSDWEVKINGVEIVNGDVSAYAGQEVTLSFTTINPRSFHPYWLIDHIRFEPIPEADVGVLIALGGAVLWLWRKAHS